MVHHKRAKNGANAMHSLGNLEAEGCLIYKIYLKRLPRIIYKDHNIVAQCTMCIAYDTVSDVVESEVHQCQQNSDA